MEPALLVFTKVAVGVALAAPVAVRAWKRRRATRAARPATIGEALEGVPVRVVGRIVDASNVALLVDVGEGTGGLGPMRAIYKPVTGERPLWDFPEGTLAGREVASALVAEATGYAVVPPTVLRDGPLGVGSVQLWIGDPFAAEPVDGPVRVVPVGRLPDGWLGVVDGQLPDGTEVTVVHEDSADLRDAAVLDAILNNSDRKGSHLAVSYTHLTLPTSDLV